jgi:hypothetical protein
LRIGNLVIPNNPHRLPTLLLDVSKIYRTYPKGVIPDAHEDDTLARLLGYASSHNGAYWSRLSALKHYKLIEGRPDIRLTELAKKLTTAPNENERSVEYLEAVCSIILWRELYNRHKFNLPQQNLWKDIVEISNCTTKRAYDVESFVREAFEMDTNSIRSYNFGPPSGTMSVVVGPTIEIKAGSYYQRVPFTAEGVNMAIEVLKAIKIPEQSH